MRERIGRLASGYIESDSPRVSAVPERIEETVYTEKWGGAFRLCSENHVQMKGLVYADDPRISVIKNQFKGYEAVISYLITVSPEEQDEVLTGCFAVVGNGFEMTVPYTFHLTGTEKMKTAARFGTLEEFAAFVREDKEAGTRLFHSQHFTSQPFMRSMDLTARYEGLVRRGHIGNALEEFLTGTGVKDQIRFTVVDSARTYQMPRAEFSDAIRIEKNTWGSFLLRLTSDEPFVELEKSQLTEKDFDGDVCQVRYRILTEHMHAGVNTAHIYIEGAYQSFAVDISCSLSSLHPQAVREETARQKLISEFTRDHVLYLCGRQASEDDLSRLQTEIGRLRAGYPSSLCYQLLHAHIYALQQKTELASMLLDDAAAGAEAQREKDPALYALYLYVRYLLEQRPDQREVLEALLAETAEKGAGGPMLFLLRLAVSRRLAEDSVYFLQECRREYEAGCRSPYFYAAVCVKYRRVPELLTHMDDMSLSALQWGSRNGMISLSLSKQAASLAVQEKNFRPGYLELLKRLHRLYSQPEVLSAVCSTLMKGNVRTPESFAWYEKGVAADLRLTRLYEFYLCTRPENSPDPLPEELLGYFAYQHSLDTQAKAVLYRYVLSHYEPGEKEYDLYRGQIEQFVMSEVLRGDIDEKTAFIYQKILYPEMVDEKAAKVLPMILHTHMVICPAARMTQAVLRYEESTEETTAPIRDGKAYLPIYGEHFHIFLQDAWGNRYTGVACEAVPLMKKEPLLSACLKLRTPHREVGFSECRALYESGVRDRAAVDRFRDTMLDPALSDVFRERLRRAVIEYFHDAREELVFDRDYLEMDPMRMDRETRILWLESLIDRSYWQEAADVLRVTGEQGVDPERILRLTEHLTGAAPDDALTLRMARGLLKEDKASAEVLSYLCARINADTPGMLAMRDRAEAAGADTADLEERLLAQMLFVGNYDRLDEIFRAYIGKEAANPMLVGAYLTVVCYQYFIEDRALEEDLFAYIEKRAMEEGIVSRLPVIHRLALTKYYYGAFILTEEQTAFGRRLVESILDDGLVFAYLKPLSRKLHMMIKLQNRQIIEYRGKKDDDLTIRYRIIPDQSVFSEEKFLHMYEGIFVKQLMAFEGDTIEYEVLSRDGGERQLLDTGKIFVCTEEGTAPFGRPGQLNHLIALEKSGDEAALKRAMEEYGVKEALAEKWFPLKK